MKTQVAFTAIYVRKISEEARNLCAIMPMNRVTRFVHTLEWKKGGGGDMSREATFRIHLNIVKRSPLVAENVVVLKVGFFPVL